MLTAATAVFALLVVFAGAVKLARPSGTVDTLRSARLPLGRWGVRLLGAAEVGVGGAALVAGGVWPPALLGAVYAGFAVFSARQLRSAGTCGCLGDASAPVTPLHVGVDAAAAAVAAGAAVAAAPPLREVVTAEPWAAPLVAVLAVAAVAVLRLALTELPALAAAVGLHGEAGAA